MLWVVCIVCVCVCVVCVMCVVCCGWAVRVVVVAVDVTVCVRFVPSCTEKKTY